VLEQSTQISVMISHGGGRAFELLRDGRVFQHRQQQLGQRAVGHGSNPSEQGSKHLLWIGGRAGQIIQQIDGLRATRD
jgi:hypothetical protein